MLNEWRKAFKENNGIEKDRNGIDSFNIPKLKQQIQNTTSQMEFNEMKRMHNSSYVCFPVWIAKAYFI